MAIVLDAGPCVLRPFRLGDEDALTRHANHPHIWLNLRDAFPHPYTRKDAEAYIARVSVIAPPRSFAVADRVTDEPVGSISVTPGEDIARLAGEVGYWLSVSYWGRGISTAAVRSITSYGFTALGLERIFAVPFAHNVASSRVLEKAGYHREGQMRRSAVKDGVVQDQYLYAAVRTEWKA